MGPDGANFSSSRHRHCRLLAIGPKCNGVGISGVRWPLDKHRLEPVVGHGVSNEVTDADGVVPITVSSGVLTIFNVPQTDPPIERN